MNPIFISMMSGPLAAALRYAATAGGGALVAKGYVDAAAGQAISGALIALVPTVIGMLTSTAAAAKTKVLSQGDVAAIKLNNGRTLTEPAQVNNSAMNDR